MCREDDADDNKLVYSVVLLLVFGMVALACIIAAANVMNARHRRETLRDLVKGGLDPTIAACQVYVPAAATQRERMCEDLARGRK